MAEERRMVSVPKKTDETIAALSVQMDEPKGKIVKIAIEEFAKRNFKKADG